MTYETHFISELIDEISMGPFGSNIKVECFVDDGVPVLNGSNLEGYELKENSFRYVTEEKADSLKKANAYRGDIVITHRGTLGQIVLIPQNSKYERYVISQSQFKVRCNDKVLPEYMVYYFHTRTGQYKLLSNASQVGVPALARPSTTFQKIDIEIPDITSQRKIIAILQKIHDKIAVNTAINENLEQQAQAIFKSWFVDFEPFGGVMPSNWITSGLLDIADYINGLAMQKFRPKENEIGLPVLKIKELRQGICDSNSELCSPSIPSNYIVKNGDVIFSWSGSLLVDFWCGDTCGLNQHLFKVISNKYEKWFYYSWTKFHLNHFIDIAADMATTMGHIKRNELAKAVVFIPNVADYSQIDNLLKPIYDAIIANRTESHYLANLRDTLLPKLMNGEIDVSKVKI